LEPWAQRRLIAVMARLVRHYDPALRLAALERCVELPVADPDRSLFAGLLEGAGSPNEDERTMAMCAILSTYAVSDAPVVGETFGRMLSNRRALVDGVRAFTAALSAPGVVSRRLSKRAQRWRYQNPAIGLWARHHYRTNHLGREFLLPAIRATIEALEPDPLTAGLRLRLAAALPWDDLDSMLTRLAESGELHAESLQDAETSVQVADGRTDPIGLERLEQALGSRADERLRRVGLAALVALAARPTGWTDARLARLEAYRADPSAMVAMAAQFTFPNVGASAGR
jgi:hypothetical protein